MGRINKQFVDFIKQIKKDRLTKILNNNKKEVNINGNGTHRYMFINQKMSDCLKSKRVAQREVNPERVIFTCKKVKAKTEIYMGEKKILKLLD